MASLNRKGLQRGIQPRIRDDIKKAIMWKRGKINFLGKIKIYDFGEDKITFFVSIMRQTSTQSL